MSAPAFQQARISDDLTLAYVDSWQGRAREDLPERYTAVVGLHGVGFNSGESALSRIGRFTGCQD